MVFRDEINLSRVSIISSTLIYWLSTVNLSKSIVLRTLPVSLSNSNLRNLVGSEYTVHGRLLCNESVMIVMSDLDMRSLALLYQGLFLSLLPPYSSNVGLG